MRRIILIVLFFTAIANATTPTMENVTKLYIATFERAPDNSGFSYWLAEIEGGKSDGTYWGHNWDNVTNGTNLLLYKITGDSQYKTKLDQHFNYWRGVISFFDIIYIMLTKIDNITKSAIIIV